MARNQKNMINNSRIRIEDNENIILLRIIFIILSLFWMVIIFIFSSQTGDTSGNLSMGLLKKLIPFQMSQPDLELIEFILRKAAHFTEYAILGSLYMMVIVLLDKFIKGRLFISTLLCFFYAISDEYHQSFSGGRTPAVRDVIIDTIGGLFGGIFCLLILFLLIKRKKRRGKKL